MREIPCKDKGFFGWASKSQRLLHDRFEQIAALPGTARKEPILTAPLEPIAAHRRQHPRDRACAQGAKHAEGLTAHPHEGALLREDFFAELEQAQQLFEEQLIPPLLFESVEGQKCLERCVGNDPRERPAYSKRWRGTRDRGFGGSASGRPR
jgi:hypothetical protein